MATPASPQAVLSLAFFFSPPPLLSRGRGTVVAPSSFAKKKSGSVVLLSPHAFPLPCPSLPPQKQEEHRLSLVHGLGETLPRDGGGRCFGVALVVVTVVRGGSLGGGILFFFFPVGLGAIPLFL